MRTIKLIYKDWRALRDFFRYEEQSLRRSYGESGNLEATFRKNYERVNPHGSAFYERAREVFGDHESDARR
jgi:hypothetical protein